MIGKSLKGYQIIEKIKDGSIGTVWFATNSRNHQFALKQLSEKNADNLRKLRRFKREAQLTRGLQHPNIVKVYEYVPAAPQPFFTMEYFPSESLKEAMYRMPERVQSREFSLLLQVGGALDHAHGRGIIHKDLKPENILISANSDVRLIDFSLSQTKMDRMLQFGRRVEGTPAYMAPEQIQGLRCDPRTDIYAFGVVMFELLTKRPLFMANSERGLLEKHLKEPVPSMRRFVPTLSPELDAFVRKLLSKRREDRPQDMTTVLYELSKWDKKTTVHRLRQVKPVSTSA